MRRFAGKLARVMSGHTYERHVRFTPITDVVRRIQVSIWLSVYEYTPSVTPHTRETRANRLRDYRPSPRRTRECSLGKVIV